MNYERGISLWEPWATLMVSGKKQHETRPMRFRQLGPLVIAATADYAAVAKRHAMTAGFRIALAQIITGEVTPSRHVHACEIGDYLRSRCGHILGVVEITDCWRTEDADTHADDPKYVSGREIMFGDWSPGRFAWIGANHRMLPTPIPFKGKQGFWKVPTEIQDEINRQLSHVPPLHP